MTRPDTIPDGPAALLRADRGDGPVMLFAPSVLQATARRFRAGFGGLVTYAVKANDTPDVITNLAAAGIDGFDVASPAEMTLIRRLAPRAALHYNNPVRDRSEIAAAVSAGVASYSVDSHGELDKLTAGLTATGAEIAVRFALPVPGAAYDFGEKFGATPEMAATLLRRVDAAGFAPALTFHPGTQCPDGAAWAAYIHEAAAIARAAGVTLARLNVGGGFAVRRLRADPDPLEPIFAAIAAATRAAFGAAAPTLVCEPGRAMVAECQALMTRVKAVRDSGALFLDDGIYGALAEAAVMGTGDRITALAPDGRRRRGAAQPRVVYGPSCDSLDRLPGTLALPGDIAEGDAVLFQGMGAYSDVTCTRFNGYGALRRITVRALTA